MDCRDSVKRGQWEEPLVIASESGTDVGACQALIKLSKGVMCLLDSLGRLKVILQAHNQIKARIKRCKNALGCFLLQTWKI